MAVARPPPSVTASQLANRTNAISRILLFTLALLTLDAFLFVSKRKCLFGEPQDLGTSGDIPQAANKFVEGVRADLAKSKVDIRQAINKSVEGICANFGKSKCDMPWAFKKFVKGFCADAAIQLCEIGSQLLFCALPSHKASRLTGKNRELDWYLAELAKLCSGERPKDEEVAELRTCAPAEPKRCDEPQSQIAPLERCCPTELVEKRLRFAVVTGEAEGWKHILASALASIICGRIEEATWDDPNGTHGFSHRADDTE